MKTPITDAAEVWFTHKYVPSEVSRLLELDRAALMEIVESYIENGHSRPLANRAAEILSTARANFP